MADSVDTSVQEQPPKLTVDQFAAKIKAKYPSYANIDNQVLAQKIIAKYPQYADTVEAPKQASAPPLSFLSQPQIQLSPVLPENRDAIQQQQDIANQRIADNLKSQQMALDPEHREAFSKAANIVTQPEQVVSDKEGADHYNYMQTPSGKALGVLKYIGSKATKGTAQVAKGASYLADMGVNPLSYATGIGNPQIDKAFDVIDKNTNFGLTKGDQQRMDENPISGAIGSLAEFIPAALGASSTGGATFYLQGLGQGKDAMDQAEKSGVQVNPLVKNAFILGTGAVNGYLMGDLGNSMFKSLPAGLRGDITASITADAIKKASGKELTGDAFKSLLDDGAKEFTDKLARGGIKTLEAYKHAVTNLSALSGANFALKKGVDITNGTPVFNEKLGDLASNLNDIATKQAPFFAIPGAIEGASKLTPYSDYKNTVVESLMKDSSPENVEKVKNDIAQYGQQNGWKPEEIQATVDHTDKIAQIAKTLPKTLPENKVVDAVDLVNNRNGLQEQLNKEQEQRSQLDPAMQEFVSPNEQMLTDKVEQANDKLRDIATGSKTTYSKGTGDEEGQFFKTINGKKEEINESRYNLEKLERTNNQQLNSTDNENESSNGEVRGEQSRQENGQNGSQENDGKGEKGSEENGQEKVVTSGEAPAEPDNYPYPKKPVDEMSSDEIRDHAKQVKDFYKGLDKQFFGEEGAKEYKAAKDVENSSFATSEQRKKAYETTAKYENSLTPEQSKIFFGENENYDDPDDLRDLAQRVHFIEESENADDLAGSIKNPLLDFAADRNSRDTNVLLKAAAKKAGELNISPQEMLKRAFDKIGDDLPGNKGEDLDGDKELLIKSILKKIAEKSTTTEINNKQLNPKQNAIQEQSPREVGIRQQEVVGEGMGGQDQPKEVAQQGKENQNEEKIKQKAVDLITHGLVVPEGFKEGDPSPRIDLGMTSADKRKAVLDISMGKYETAPAKKLIQKVVDFEKNGEYPVIEGLGGASIRHRAIPSIELNQHLEDAKANKIGELSQRQIDEFNESAKELGITAEDIQNYEQYRESTLGRTDNSSTTESPSGVIQQSQNDETTSSPQSSSGETTQGSEPTGVRNADVEKERGKVVPREVITKDEVEKEGKRLVDSGEVDPDALAQDIIDNKKPVTAQEQAALLYHKTKLKNRQRAILKDDNPENTVENQIEYARNEDLLAKNQEATEIAGNVTGRALGFRTETMNEDYSRNSVFRRAKLANNGEDLDKGDKEVLEKHTKKIEELENQLADREEEIRKLQDKDTVSKVKRNSEFEERQAKREITKASLRKEREALVAELHLQARKSLGKLGANKIPLEMLPALTKLARNYVLDGAVSISGVADRIYNDLKDHLEGISKEDISDAIKNGFDDYLDEQNKIRLERSKKRQQTKLKNVREQLETGNYEKRVQKKIAVDNDYLKIRAEINRQQLLINKKIDDIANSQKSIGRKAVDFAVKYGRQSKLASVPVLGKLAATGLTTMGIKGATEGVGKVFSTLLPQITKKSTVEGSVSMQALHEANKYTEGNAVKSIAQAYARAATIGMKDAYDEINIKKGGQSDLSALYGKYTATRLPAEAAELFGHIHSAIKAPIKRFAWEHSYAKRVAKGIENGIDVQDPVIDAKNRLDAYKDAERAIFMGDNFISKGYEASMKTLENANEPYKKNIAAITRILLPFVKVPTNIALSTGRYAFGSLLGAGKLAQIGTSSLAKIAGAEGLAKAIHKGMGELTPEESDMVLRNLKHGSVGGAAVLLGFFHPKNVGGYYQEGEHRKKGEAKAGSIKIFGHQIPMWMTEHPVFQAMQIGATFRRVLDAHRHKDDNVSAAALATASGLVEGIPLANEAKQFTGLMGNQPKKAYRFGSQLIKGEIEPAAIQQLATATDTKNGAPISFNEDNQQKRVPRKNRGFIKYLKQDLASGIPGLRKTVPKK